jgi:hypothetical protein
MKKYVLFLLAVLLLPKSIPVYAQETNEPPKEICFTIGSPFFQVDGKEQLIDSENPDVVPFIDEESGCTMIPLRAFGELLGYQVHWNVEQPNEIVLSLKQASSFTFMLGKPEIHAAYCRTNIEEPTEYHWTKEFQFSAPPQTKWERTFIPLRGFSEILGFHVVWSEVDQTAALHLKQTDELIEQKAVADVKGCKYGIEVTNLADIPMRIYDSPFAEICDSTDTIIWQMTYPGAAGYGSSAPGYVQRLLEPGETYSEVRTIPYHQLGPSIYMLPGVYTLKSGLPLRSLKLENLFLDTSEVIVTEFEIPE